MIISQTDDACAAAALLRWTSLGLWRLHSEWYSWWIQIWLAETDVLNGFHSLKARGATLGYDNGSHRHGTNCCHGHAATGAVTPQVRSRNYGSSQRNPPTKKCWQGSKRFRFKHLKTCFCSSDPVMKPRLKSIFWGYSWCHEEIIWPTFKPAGLHDSGPGKHQQEELIVVYGLPLQWNSSIGKEYIYIYIW